MPIRRRSGQFGFRSETCYAPARVAMIPSMVTESENLAPGQLQQTGRLSVTFVVPCFNEEAALPLFVDRVSRLAARASECDFHCLFVDDGSEDETPAILDELARRSPNIGVLPLGCATWAIRRP